MLRKVLLVVTLLCAGFLAAQTYAEEINRICGYGSFVEREGSHYFIIYEEKAAGNEIGEIAYASVMFVPTLYNW